MYFVSTILIQNDRSTFAHLVAWPIIIISNAIIALIVQVIYCIILGAIITCLIEQAKSIFSSSSDQQ